MSLSKNRFAQGGCAKFELILEEISGSLNLFWFYLAILLVFLITDIVLMTVKKIGQFDGKQ